MTSHSSSKEYGRSVTVKQTFSRHTTIHQIIHATPSIVWSLLTNAEDFPRWNSTVISVDGKIEQGGKIRLKSTLDANRTFKLKVKKYVPDQELVWGDAMGERIYTLQLQGDDTLFTMSERIGGPIFPLFASKIPSFDASFEQFTADLKKEAESK